MKTEDKYESRIRQVEYSATILTSELEILRSDTVKPKELIDTNNKVYDLDFALNKLIERVNANCDAIMSLKSDVYRLESAINSIDVKCTELYQLTQKLTDLNESHINNITYLKTEIDDLRQRYINDITLLDRTISDKMSELSQMQKRVMLQ